MSPLGRFASLRCDAEFGRYRGIAALTTRPPAIFWVHGLNEAATDDLATCRIGQRLQGTRAHTPAAQQVRMLAAARGGLK